VKTKTLGSILAAVLFSGTLTACGSTEVEPADPGAPVDTVTEATPVDTATEATAIDLTDSYDDALTAKNQLLLGTLRLEETDQAITSEQAKELLLLWRALAALTASGTAAPEETEAVQNQIMENMTPEQVGAVAAMELTNAALQEFYLEVGLTEVKTPEPGATPQSAGMKDLSQEDREATRIANGAEPSGSGSGSGKSSALMDMVIELMEEK